MFCDFTMTVSSMLTTYSVAGDNLSQSLKHILSPKVSISAYIVDGDNMCRGDKLCRHTSCPGACFFFLHVVFVSCVVIQNSMILNPIIWWKFRFFFLKLLHGHWNVPAIQQHSVGMNAHGKVTEHCLKSGFKWTFLEHSMYIKKCSSWLKGESSFVCHNNQISYGVRHELFLSSMS